MFDAVWLIAAALAGWASGRNAKNHELGSVSDVFLGLTGAFVVRWSFHELITSLPDVYLLLFSIWGAAALPAIVSLAIRRHNRAKVRSQVQGD